MPEAARRRRRSRGNSAEESRRQPCRGTVRPRARERVVTIAPGSAKNISTETKPPAFFEEDRILVDAFIDRLLPALGTQPPSIHEAMRYSVLAGGKRIRPIL